MTAPTRRAWWWLLPLVVAAVAGAIFTVARREGTSSSWSTVQSAFGGERPFEPRISGVPFGRFSRVRSGPSAVARAPSELLLASAILDQQAQTRRSPAAYRQAAVARLLLHDADSAVSFLQQAISRGPADASLQSDLAAAYLIRSALHGTTVDTVRALDAARRSVEMNPLGEGWFNLALALDRLRLKADAASAWVRVASQEQGGWRDEALTKAAVLPQVDRDGLSRQLEPVMRTGDVAAVQEAAAAQPDVVGEIVERKLLGEWATAIREGNLPSAEQMMRRASLIARAIRDASGDRYFGAVVDQLRQCRSRCAEGWSDHLRALDAWDAERFTEARTASGRADEILGTSISTVNAGRSLVRITLARLNGRHEDALTWLRAFEQYSVDQHFLSLAGRLRWQRALNASESGDFGQAVTLYESAREMLTQARDREGLAVVHAQLAYKYQQIDDIDRAWQHEFDALSALSVCRPLRRTPILTIAAFLAGATGLDGAAVAFRAPLIDEARRTRSPVNLAFRLAEDVPNLKNIGRRDLAAERIAEADRSVDRIDDPGTASMARARVDLTHGQFLLDETPRRAAALFDSAIDVYRRRGDAFPIPSLQLDRGRALLRAGAVADAEAAFADGVSASERERHTVVAEADRVLALSARWDLYASLVDLRILRRDDTGALALLERARALKASSSVDGTAPISTVVLPPGTLAIEYAVLPSGMVGWVIAGSERGRFDVALGVPALEELVSDYRTAVQRRADRRVVSELSRRIFAAVLGPVRDRLRHATHLIIVADGPLHDVPFAALEDPQTGRALVEDATVAMSPSLESLNPRQVETEPRRLRALVVGNPDRTGAAGETLGELPASLREAEDVARMYSGARLSVGSAATRQLFLERLPQVDVVHFAGHAIVNDRQPQLSRLMLAPAKDDSIGAVFASDIDRLDLSRLRLVVLSACETARGRVARGSGVIGLVRTFLAAGANTVVATLWPIDDRSAANLFTAFHARWVGGLSAADALRQAQLALRNAGRADVIDWAGAEVVGMSVIP